MMFMSVQAGEMGALGEMAYLYHNHVGGVYSADHELSGDDLYCEQCGDSDDSLGAVEPGDERALIDAALNMNDISGTPPLSWLCTPAGLADYARELADYARYYVDDEPTDLTDSAIDYYVLDVSTCFPLIIDAVLRQDKEEWEDYGKPDPARLQEMLRQQILDALVGNGVYPLDEEKMSKQALDRANGKSIDCLLADELIGLNWTPRTGKMEWSWGYSHDAYVHVPDPWWSVIHRAYCDNVAGYREAWDHLTAGGSKIKRYRPEWAEHLERDLPGLKGKIYEYAINDVQLD